MIRARQSRALSPSSPFNWRSAWRRCRSVSAWMRSSRPSASVRSSLPFSKARRVNSPGSAGANIFESGQRREQSRQHRASAMDVKFRDVFAGRAGRTRKPQHHRIVDRPLADIPKQRAGGHSRRRQFAGQRRHDLSGLRTRDAHHGNRARRPARRQCKDGLIPRMHGLFVREVLKRQRNFNSGPERAGRYRRSTADRCRQECCKIRRRALPRHPDPNK